MKNFRKVLFWLHLISGSIAGIVIFMMCVTGALLSFQPNILKFAESEMRTVVPPPVNTKRLSINEIIAKVREAKADAKPSNIVLQNDKNAAATISLGREGQVFVNPYTGAITGEGAKSLRGAFRVVEDFHRWIALSGGGRPIGKAITGVCNLMFLFLAISGIYIWFPRRLSWKHFRASMLFRRKVKGKARHFNWHTVIGFWSSPVLIILTLTATVISYQWAGNLIYTLTGNEIPQQQQSQQNSQNEQVFILPENLNELFIQAENQRAWKTITLRLPIAKDAAVFTIDEGIYWNIFGRSTLTIDIKTGEIAKWESYGEQNSARQIRSWSRFTHTGESFGFFGQFVGFLACIGGAILVWTGISLTLRRFRHWFNIPKKINMGNSNS